MSSLLISPHNDDEALFCGVLCQRVRPMILICLDSYIQPNRGELGCSAEQRWRESVRAAKILGCDIRRLRLRDDTVTEDQLVKALRDFDLFRVIYAPAIQEGGNVHHNMVARAAVQVFGNRVRQYTTYTRTQLHTVGDIEIAPTPAELQRKQAALECYQSQMRINHPHFAAVMGKSEWLMEARE